MMSLVAKLTIKEGKEQDFIDAMKDVVPAVREEPGNHAYIMNRSKENPRMFVFYEEYTDKAAFDAHRKHLGELGVDLAAILDGAPALEIYDKIY